MDQSTAWKFRGIAILILAFINGIMAVGRSFVGPVVHKLSSPEVLLASSITAFLGLLWLSVASGWMTFAAAFVVAAGVCYFWPTMLGFVSAYVPESGALGLNIMGGAGMLSVSFILPVMSRWFDENKAQALAKGVSDHAAALAAGRDTLQQWLLLFLISDIGISPKLGLRLM